MAKIIKGGGLSARIAKRWVEDLGVSIEKAPSLKVHRNTSGSVGVKLLLKSQCSVH
jgi:hypothetical protein